MENENQESKSNGMELLENVVKSNERNIALECTKMEAEEDIEKVTFYANNEKISYSDLLEKLQ